MRATGVHQTVGMVQATVEGTIRAIGSNEFGNVVIEVDLDHRPEEASLGVENIDGLACTVLERHDSAVRLVVQEYLAYATDHWQVGQRTILTLRPTTA